MKIAIAIPTHSMVPAEFMYDLASLCAFTVSNLPDKVDFGLHMVQGTYVHNARADLAEDTLEADAVLWLDSDMRFPRDALFRLWKHEEPVVGINYASRGIPSNYVAIKRIGFADQGQKLVTNDDSEGLEEVDAIGMGCVLIRREALRGLPDPKETPWFQNVHLGNGKWMGEDVWFCKLLRESGVRILVDHDLSKMCQHVGHFEYELVHAELAREPEPVS